MAKIGVIAPDQFLYEHTVLASREMRIEDEVEVVVGNLWEMAETAQKMLDRGVEVIVSRGLHANFLTRSDPPVAVITITLSSRDIFDIIQEARRITGLDKPRIAIIAVQIMNRDVKLFSDALGIDIDVYPVSGTPESICQAIDEVGRNGADLVVGGAITMRMAEADGIPAMHIPSSVESMKIILAEAVKVLRAVGQEQRRTRRFETLLRHLREGVLYVESNGRVRIANAAAELMLGRSSRELCACDIGDILPNPAIAGSLAGLSESVEEIVSVGDATLIATLIPAHMGQEPSGVIVSLQETNRISQMDTKIRRVLGERGLSAPYRFENIWGGSAAIRETKRLAAEYAAVDSTVLIFGETGTGKELFAQSIHNASRHAGGPFVAVNCAALPPSLLESELFGYEEGAFTGANRRGKAGLIELAHNGTLFLDEISEMDAYGQVRLLRFLQERQIMRLGGDKYVPVHTRVIAATNRDLGALVARREFREDLFYRLKVLNLNVPPLRDRHGDIALLVERLLASWEEELGHKTHLAPEVMPILVRHYWPGNIRELANAAENLAVAGRRRLITGAMVEGMLLKSHSPTVSDPSPAAATESPERDRIVEALAAAGSRKADAAKALGMHRSTLHRKMRMHGIELRPR